VSLRGALARARGLALWIAGHRGRTAGAWAALTLVVLLALGGGPGISRDEAAVLEVADGALRAPGALAPPQPPLAPGVATAARLALAPLGVSRARAARVPTAIAGAALSALLAAAAWELSGPGAALLAPALFWAAPRHLHAGLVSTPDLLAAGLVLAAALAFRHAGERTGPRARLRAAIAAGLLLGVALAARPDTWVVAGALALHALLVRVLRAAPPPAEGERPRRVPPRILAILVLAPLVLLALWPALLWSAPARAAAVSVAGRSAAALALGGAGLPAFAFPLSVTALTVPLALLVVLAGGVVHALLRLSRALSSRAPEGRRELAPRAVARDELWLLLLAAAPLGAAALGLGPAAGGVRPWLPAMPFLALLGARAMVRGAAVAWPARPAPVLASLALLVLWPALRATAHAQPAGASAWNELAGGAPGAATLGLPRQDGGEAAVRLLDAVNARAREGARVWWPTSSPAAIRCLALDGRLRADLTPADGPEDADLAVVTLDVAGRDAEYRTWAAFRTARPVAGAYVDEVPLAFAYARPGAWR
jgi:hypothetical protein